MRVLYANNMAPGVGVVKCLSVCVCEYFQTLQVCRCVCEKHFKCWFFFFQKCCRFSKENEWSGGAGGIEIKVLIKGGINTMLIKWASGRGSRCCYSIL